MQLFTVDGRRIDRAFAFWPCYYSQEWTVTYKFPCCRGDQSTGNCTATGQPDDNREKEYQCYICKGAHNVDLCTRFLAMMSQERWKVVKEQRDCFSCLKRSRGLSSGNAWAKKRAPKKDAMVLRVESFTINFFTSIMDWKDQRTCKFHLFKTVAKRYLNIKILVIC